jgi:glucokinase
LIKRAASAGLLRDINRSSVLDYLRQSGPVSCSEIARQLNMSAPTVTRILNDLLKINWVQSVGQRSEHQVGRPGELFVFNGSKHAVIGLDLGGTKLLGAVTDLQGNIQKEIQNDSCPGDAQKNLDLVDDLVRDLIESNRPSGMDLLGVGVGAPGVTHAEEGIVTWAPSLGWRDLPLATQLSKSFQLPVFVENDVNLATIGELDFGAGKGVENLICIAIGTGIGSGIVIDGALYRGQDQAAGEIGYLPPGVEYLNHRYDQFGALEGLASGKAIAERARQLLLDNGRATPSDQFGAEDVFEAARRQEPWALKIVDETVSYLALGIAAYACLVNPDMIILSGGVSRASDLLIGPILKRIEGVVPFTPKLVASPLGNRAALLGAITLVLNQAMEHSEVRK